MAWTTAVSALLVALAACATGTETDAQHAALRQVSDANNAFSIDLYQALSRAKGGNLVVSPLSASAALALVLQGAGGRTAEQLHDALRLPPRAEADPDALRQGFRRLFTSLLQSSEEVVVRMANKVYTRKGAAPKEPFRRVAVDAFRADAQELDFGRDTEAARRTINTWVEQVTDSKIKDLLESLDKSTLMVVVNAIYFKGSWESPFDEEATRDEPFHTSPTAQVSVPMMHLTDTFRYAALPALGARVLELPYKGGSVKMWVLLPDAVDGLPRLEQGLGSLNLSAVDAQMSGEEVILSMPKFKIESTFHLENTLPELGVRDLFQPGANLTGITDFSSHVSQVIQKAFVEVSENGTVAAAATAVQIATHAAFLPPPQFVTFKIDRPFLFLIVNSDQTSLFLGRIQQPSL